MKTVFLFILFSLSLSNANASISEEEFWVWFVDNQSEIYDFKKADEPIFNKFSKQLELVNSELGFEFSGVKENGKRELTISAGGITSNIQAVEKLYAAAPKLEQWEVLKFKQRKTELDGFKLGYEGQVVEYKNVRYKAFEDNGKLGVVLFFNDFSKDKYDFFVGIAFLFLDLSLGEYDVMTKVGFIEVMGDDSKYFESSRSLKDIVSDFDHYYNSQK